MLITQEKAPMQAGMLCNDVAFQNYAAVRNGFKRGEFNRSTSAEHIRQICRISSRKELSTNPEAFKRFQAMHLNFEIWSGRVPTPR